jgi:hypothetical protein
MDEKQKLIKLIYNLGRLEQFCKSDMPTSDDGAFFADAVVLRIKEMFEELTTHPCCGGVENHKMSCYQGAKR